MNAVLKLLSCIVVLDREASIYVSEWSRLSWTSGGDDSVEGSRSICDFFSVESIELRSASYEVGSGSWVEDRMRE